MKPSFVPLRLSILTAFLATSIHADQITTSDGSSLIGKITRIQDGSIHLTTSFAGEIMILQSQVASMQTDEPLIFQLSDGRILTQPLSPTPPSGIPSMDILAAGDALSPAQPLADPVPSMDEESIDKTVPNPWKFEGAVGISGKSGNADKDDFSGALKALLENPQYRIECNLRYQMSESRISTGENQRTADETIGSVNYTSFFRPNLGWYAKQSLERDRFENLELRSLSSVGLTWKTINRERFRLEFNSGLGYRYETYGFDLNQDGWDDRTGSSGSPSIDFGLKLYSKLTDWLEWNSSLDVSPTSERLSDYRMDHLSTVDIPLGVSDRWKLRFSLANQYKSNAPSHTEKLDTSYSLSILLKWD